MRGQDFQDKLWQDSSSMYAGTFTITATLVICPLFVGPWGLLVAVPAAAAGVWFYRNLFKPHYDDYKAHVLARLAREREERDEQ